MLIACTSSCLTWYIAKRRCLTWSRVWRVMVDRFFWLPCLLWYWSISSPLWDSSFWKMTLLWKWTDYPRVSWRGNSWYWTFSIVLPESWPSIVCISISRYWQKCDWNTFCCDLYYKVDFYVSPYKCFIHVRHFYAV